MSLSHLIASSRAKPRDEAPAAAVHSDQSEEQRFRSAVPKSWKAVWRVAEHYQLRGYSVTLPGYQMRDRFEEREGFGDDADLLVGDRWRFEIKWREVDFTCADDFPYPSVLVDRVEKADKVKDTVSAYISVNKAMTHVAIIDPATREKWGARKRFDHVKRYPLDVYECPKHLVRFEKLRCIEASP